MLVQHVKGQPDSSTSVREKGCIKIDTIRDTPCSWLENNVNYHVLEIYSDNSLHSAHNLTNNCVADGSTEPFPFPSQVLLPLHFDRSVIDRSASLQRSVALRPFKTRDFMTGVPALPGRDLPTKVCLPYSQGGAVTPTTCRTL